MPRVEAPQHAGSREQAQALLAQLPPNLTGVVVVLDCGRTAISTPSFVDEIVKELLVDREAARLDVVGANERTQGQVVRAAENRNVATRVQSALRV